MDTSTFDQEFQRYRDGILAGKSLPERLAILVTLKKNWEREGQVPVQNKIISLGPQHRQLSYELPSAAPATGTQSKMSGKRLAGGFLMLALLAWVILGFGDGRSGAAISGPVVPSKPVTAAAGATAPVSVVFGGQTLRVRSFDPIAGWPDVTASEVEGAALWGGTTINLTLGVDEVALEEELDALTPGSRITVQQAQGDVVTYRVIEQIQATTTDIKYAAQKHVGLTIVGMSAGTSRRIIRAFPEAVPVPVTEIEGIRFEVRSPLWQRTANEPLKLALSLDIGLPGGGETVPAAWDLSIQLPDGTHQSVSIVPGADASTQTVEIVIPETDGEVVELGLQLPGSVSGSVALALPPRPTASVQFRAAYRTADGIAVQLTLIPVGPMQLDGDVFTCRSSLGTTPLILDGLAFSTVITTQEEVIGHCAVPGTARGQVELVVMDDRAIVPLN